jgi:hypothetical protein
MMDENLVAGFKQPLCVIVNINIIISFRCGKALERKYKN